MKKNITIKLITILTLIFILTNYIPTTSSAMSVIENAISSGKGFINTPTDSKIKDNIDGGKIEQVSKDAFNVVFTIGVAVAAIIIFVLGIQFIMGSIEQKVKVKEMLIPYCIGCIVVFGAIGIWRIVISIASVIN